jgi:hypothetical protein
MYENSHASWWNGVPFINEKKHTDCVVHDCRAVYGWLCELDVLCCVL